MISKLIIRTISLTVLAVMGITLLAPPTRAAFELPGKAEDVGFQAERAPISIEAESDSGPAYLVKDINLESDSFPYLLIDIDGILFFDLDDGVHGDELWKSDGTESGTEMVKDINPSVGSSPRYLTAVNDFFFFSANDGIHGIELWKSNGTEAGTVMVKDIYTGSDNSYPSGFQAVASTLYFLADDGVHGRELWKSDGTDSGTVMVKDINPSGPSISGLLTNINGILFFYGR